MITRQSNIVDIAYVLEDITTDTKHKELIRMVTYCQLQYEDSFLSFIQHSRIYHLFVASTKTVPLEFQIAILPISSSYFGSSDPLRVS